MMKERKCKHCKTELPDWQAKNAQYCQDSECKKDVAKLNNKKQRDRMKREKESLK